MAGVPIKSSINANQTRVDFLDLVALGTRGDAGHRFLRRGRANGVSDLRNERRIAAAYIFYFVTGFQVWNESPRSGAYISNLAIPTGY